MCHTLFLKLGENMWEGKNWVEVLSPLTVESNSKISPPSLLSPIDGTRISSLALIKHLHHDFRASLTFLDNTQRNMKMNMPWNALKIVKRYAVTTEPCTTWRTPKIHVAPRRNRRARAPRAQDLGRKKTLQTTCGHLLSSFLHRFGWGMLPRQFFRSCKGLRSANAWAAL